MEDKLKDNNIRYPISETADMAKTIQTKQVNTTSVQTESSESDYSNYMSKINVKSIHHQDKINYKKKLPNPVKLKENVMGHHQRGEIPKYN